MPKKTVRLRFEKAEDLKLIEALADKSGQSVDDFVAYCVMKVISSVISKENNHARQADIRRAQHAISTGAVSNSRK